MKIKATGEEARHEWTWKAHCWGKIPGGLLIMPEHQTSGGCVPKSAEGVSVAYSGCVPKSAEGIVFLFLMFSESKFVLNPNGSSCRDVKVRNSTAAEFSADLDAMVGIELGASDSFSFVSRTSPISVFHFVSPLSPTLAERTHRLTGAAPQRSVAHSAGSMASATEFSADSESVSDSHRRTIGDAYGGATNDRRS
nr:hypothetical protein Itr_chr12CG12430 [Ipomoea trifida]